MTAADFAIMKTDRAKIHLDAFNCELNQFAHEPDSASTHDYIEGPWYVRRTQFRKLPPIMGMLLGEFLYCLRSGLDQMAWQLALPEAKGDVKSARRICFPIVKSISDKKDRENWMKLIRPFPDAVAKLIETFQPYREPGSPKDHPLWQLNELCNIDKHRIIPFHSRSMEIFVPNNPAAVVSHFDNADIVEVRIPLSGMNQMRFKANPTVQIEIGEWNSDFVLPVSRLPEMCDFIKNQLIPKFAGFAPSRAETPSMRIADIKAVYAEK